MAYALVNNIEYLLCSQFVLQDVNGTIEACNAGMEGHNRVCALFWRKWGPVLRMFCWALIQFMRVLVLLVLGLLENLISALHGLRWLINQISHFLDRLMG